MNSTKMLATVVALFLCQQASAVNLYCTGTVKRVYVDSSARVFIRGDWNLSYQQVCSLDTSWKGIGPDICKTWFAMLQGAYHAASPTIVNYTGVSAATCADLPAYGSAPSPGYVMNYE